MPDRYEFLRKVAEGGFGRVYLAKDTRLGREVAIKRLLSPDESASFEQAQATFEREATTLAALQHPNIVQIYDFDRDEEGTYVVMEMLEGETLKDRLNRGPLTWDTFVTVARQALDAINAAHSQDILHRDLKPENLFIHRTSSGMRVLKILDFGLAKLSNVPSRQTMDQSGNVFGSIYYMAPEQFMRQPLDGRTDLYALGCVFYQALTARFPFYGENMQATMEAHMEHEVKPLRARRPDISAPVADWLMRLISFLPADRPADALTALRELEAALEGRTLQPAPKTPSASVAARPASPLPHAARMTAAGPATVKPGGSPSARPNTPPTARPGEPSPSSGVMKTPMQTRAMSAVEANRVDAKAKEDVAAGRKRLLLKVGAAVAGVAVLIFAITRKGPDRNATQATPALPEPAPLTLPIEGSLVWRFRAGAESRHKTAEGKLDTGSLLQGQTVHFWRNLASTEKLDALVPYEGKAERTPPAQPADIRALGAAQAHFYFSPISGMETKVKESEAAQAPGGPASKGAGVTVAAVFRANGDSKESTMRLLALTSANAKHSFSLHLNPRAAQFWTIAQREGKTAQSLVTHAELAKRTNGAGGAWIAVVAVWDAKQGTVSFRARSNDGPVVAGPPATIPPGIAALNRLNLGFFNVPKETKLNSQEKFDGDIIEVAVYRLPLDPATQDKLLDALWEHYFGKR